MVDKVLHAQMPFTTGKQTINDRLTAAYHSLAGSQLGKTVCKATTEEEIGPKKKHLDYLLHCTNEPNVSIPQLANLLVERTTSSNWCTVYKALISIHNLMCYGNERFSQYLASSNANFNMGSFLDKTSVQGYDMSTHVRRYAKYIGEKIYTYRMMAFDFCKVKRGREDGLLRTMPTDRLLKTLPLLQEQIDVLLDFQINSAELNNGVINSCFILLFRDLIRLFACYNDGMINLLEKYFDMNKKQCKDALELYKNFLTRMDKVAEFLKVAESVGIDKCEIPDLTRAPSSLVEALEQHLVSLEGGVVTANGSSQKAGSRVTSPTSWTNTQNAIHQLSSSGGFASMVVDPNDLDDQMRAKILQEEEQRLHMLKEQRLREIELSGRSRIDTRNTASAPKTNPFLQTPVNDASAKSSSIDDLLSLDFSTPVLAAPAGAAAASSTNPFTSMTSSLPNAVNPYASAFGGGQQHDATATMTASFVGAPSNNYTNGHSTSTFASDDHFAKAFPSQSTDSHAGYQPANYYSSAEVGQQQAQNSIRAPSRPSLTPSDQDIEIPPASGFNPFLTEDSTPKIPYAVESQESIEEDHSVVAANPFAVFQKNAQAFVSAESSSLYVIGDPSAAETPSPQPPYGGLSPQPRFEESESNQFFPAAAAAAAVQLQQPSTAPTSHHGTPSKMSTALDAQSTNRPASQPSGAAQQQSAQYQAYDVAFEPQFTSNVPDPNGYRNLQHQVAQQTGFSSWMPGKTKADGPLNLDHHAYILDSASQQPSQQQTGYAYQQQTRASNQFGDLNVLAPQKPGQQRPSTTSAGGKLIKGDLDSTLANLAQNLNISKGQDALKNKPVQWNPQQKPVAFQGSFAPQQGPPSGYGYQQQQQPMAPGWGAQPMMMGQNAQYGMQMPYGQPQQAMYNMQPAGVQPSGYMGMMNHPQQSPQVRPPMNNNSMNASDPFGTL